MSNTEEVNVDVQIPSDTEIRKEMEILMQSINLATTSTKQFTSILSTKFNGADLSTKKKYIKATIIEIIDSIQDSDEEEQFNQVFRENNGISNHCYDDIYQIKYNQSYMREFALQDGETNQFTQLTWTLLGRYIANNTHLERVDLVHCNLTDEKMASLFYELTCSTSLQKLDVCKNHIGIEGIRSMLPFLLNSPNLSNIDFSRNNNFNSECFELLVSTLNGKAVKELYFYDCNITNISALDTYNLPNLKEVNLGNNNIGRDGCITISNLLQKKGSTLAKVVLINTGMGDEEAELLASSLKHNTSLKELYIDNNNITERGQVAFLKVLNDVSSIENTYNSNYTLKECRLIGHFSRSRLQAFVNSACRVNISSTNPGRTKVIRSHLNSQTLKKLCLLQGMNYSYGDIFADIEPNLLPRILASIGHENGLSDLYTALTQTAPDLLSYIDRKALIRDIMTRNEARAAALVAECERKIAALKNQLLNETSHITAENNGLSNRLALIELGDIKQSAAGE